MTREEAIKIFNEVLLFGKAPCTQVEFEELAKMSIQALEQEPTTKNDLGVDYRSLEDIKKLVERKADELDGVMLDAGGVIIGLYFAIANALPSVTPIRPKGHWIRVTDKARHLVWECDKCGWQQRFNTNFCPDCGCAMVEPRESEDKG